MADAVINMISLARRAGHVVSGDTAVRGAIDRRRAKLIIMAEDTAERTRKALEPLAGDAGIPLILHGTKEELGMTLGKPSRAVVAITDYNIARGIIRASGRGEA